jgi:competence protein ComGC
MMLSKNLKKGFTLIEMLVVIGIVMYIFRPFWTLLLKTSLHVDTGLSHRLG